MKSRLAEYGERSCEYSLLPSQREFMEVPHGYALDVAVYQGGFGSGKTFCGSLLGVILALKHAGIRGLVGASTQSLLRDTTLVSYLEHLDRMGFGEGREYAYNRSESRITFANGSEILFRHLEDENRLKSLNLGFVEIEEMSDVPHSAFKMLLGRLRQAGIPRYRLFGHTNPESSKGWIYRTFVEQSRPNYRMVFAPTTQNVFLPQGFAQELKNCYDSEYYRINVLGEWGDYTSGLVTKGWGADNVQQAEYVNDLPLHISCDFNVDPMCWVMAHRSEDTAVFFDEIAMENTSTDGAVSELLRRYPDHRGPIVVNGDASGDNRSTQSEFTNYAIIRNRLLAHGYSDVRFELRPYNPPVKNRVAAWNSRVRDAQGNVHVIVSSRCERLLYNVHNLRYREGTSEIELPSYSRIRADRDSKFMGHPFDAASYLVERYWPVAFA